MRRNLKNLLLKIYRDIRYYYNRYIVSHRWRNSKTNFPLSKIFSCENSFFGYYNLSPENSKGEVIAGSVKNEDDSNDYLLLCSTMDTSFAKTEAWNWQQGAMLQWSKKSDQIVFYNVFIDGEYKAVKFNIDKSEIVKIFPKPIYSISADESFYLSLNFERLTIMRPDYGYFCRKQSNIPMLDLAEDGIWHICTDTLKSSLIISLQQLYDLKPSDTMKGANHKVNHIDISPDGRRFMFLHRWIGPAGRYTRLITADSDGKNLFILNGDKMTSHSCWQDNSHIISFCHTEIFGNAYVRFKDQTDNVELISSKLPVVDGHPSVSPDGEWMCTDSYPKFDRFSKLYLYHFKTDKIIPAGSFFQPRCYLNTKRIDLRPKWNWSGSKVYFESGHSGRRELYAIDVSDKDIKL